MSCLATSPMTRTVGEQSRGIRMDKEQGKKARMTPGSVTMGFASRVSTHAPYMMPLGITTLAGTTRPIIRIRLGP